MRQYASEKMAIVLPGYINLVNVLSKLSLVDKELP